MSRYLLIGLGNPGDQYERSRHNAGWLALDELVRLWSDPAIKPVWKLEKKIEAEVLRLQRGGHELILVKPQTYMNDSGRAVAAAIRWYLNRDPALEPGPYRDLVVFHDDLDLTTGQYKLQFDSGPKVHNGLNSIRDHLKTTQFWVARLGVDSRGGQRQIPGQAYVLQPFASEEQPAVRRAIGTLSEELPYLVLE
jgi:PTH1 family peptidyl-tRNA hydrolase